MTETINISLGPLFPQAEVEKDAFTVQIVDTDATSDYEQTRLYILSADPATRELEVKFPGAPTGNYYLSI